MLEFLTRLSSAQASPKVKLHFSITCVRCCMLEALTEHREQNSPCSEVDIMQQEWWSCILGIKNHLSTSNAKCFLCSQMSLLLILYRVDFTKKISQMPESPHIHAQWEGTRFIIRVIKVGFWALKQKCLQLLTPYLWICVKLIQVWW